MKENKKNSIKEIELLKKKNEEYLNGWKRAKADYINYKKEQEKSAGELIRYANAAMVMELLPIFNNMKLAAKHIPEDEKKHEWVKGLLQINKQFKTFLENLGITEIKTLGEKFDPELHEAISHDEKDEISKDMIFEEVNPGYKMHDKVLIAAKVKVAK